MSWGFIVALVLAIPIILFPVAFIWYVNFGGIYQTIRDAWKRQAVARRKKTKAIAEVGYHSRSENT